MVENLNTGFLVNGVIFEMPQKILFKPNFHTDFDFSWIVNTW